MVNIITKALSTVSDNGQSENTPLIAVLLTVILMLNTFISGFSHFTATTRVAYAMARDGAFPGGKWLATIHPLTKNPEMCVLLIFFLDAIMALLPMISSSFFSAVTQTIAAGLQISYLIPVSIRMYL